MKTNILLIFIIILVGSRINGQDPESSFRYHKTYSLNLHVGMNQIKEMNLLPLVHKGMISELSFETEKRKDNLRLFQFNFAYSRLKTSLEEMSKSANIKLGMNYSYNYPVYQKNNLRYYLGPQVSLSYSLMVFPNWDESHSYWADYLSFGANNILSMTHKNENEWFSSLSFSLLGFFSRPDEIRPYKMDDYTLDGILKAFNSNIESGLMNKVLLINYRTEYRFPVLNNKMEAITFNLDVLRISRHDEQPVFQIKTLLGIKIIL